tara:strand:- start:195 stop:515 length:321 start_codon:yes stop_codon:yes gene_type:complete
MAFYEHTFIGKQDLSSKEFEKLVKKYSDIISESGKLLKTEKWGLLNLATKINKNRKGIFVHFKFESKDGTIRDIEKKLAIENNVIRFLTVKYNKLDLKKEYFAETK